MLNNHSRGKEGVSGTCMLGAATSNHRVERSVGLAIRGGEPTRRVSTVPENRAYRSPALTNALGMYLGRWKLMVQELAQSYWYATAQSRLGDCS